MLVAFEKLILIWHNWNSAKTRNQKNERVFFRRYLQSTLANCQYWNSKFKVYKFLFFFTCLSSMYIFWIFIHFFLTFGTISMKLNDFFYWRITSSFYLCGQYGIARPRIDFFARFENFRLKIREFSWAIKIGKIGIFTIKYGKYSTKKLITNLFRCNVNNQCDST